jgi:hypothetical protein
MPVVPKIAEFALMVVAVRAFVLVAPLETVRPPALTIR